MGFGVVKHSHDKKVLEAIKVIIVVDYSTKPLMFEGGSINPLLCNKGEGEIQGVISTKSMRVYRCQFQSTRSPRTISTFYFHFLSFINLVKTSHLAELVDRGEGLSRQVQGTNREGKENIVMLESMGLNGFENKNHELGNVDAMKLKRLS